jgi:hypothetical protein
MLKFWLGAASLLLAGSSMFAEVDQALLDLVPSDAMVVAGVQIEKSKASPVGQYLLSKMQTGQPGAQKLIDQTGFDPRRDLHEIVIATTGPQQNPRKPAVTVIARGVFDRSHIKTALLSKGGQVETINDVDILTGSGNHVIALAILDPTLAIAGQLSVVRSIVLNRNSPNSLGGQLAKNIALASRDNEAWFASVYPGSLLPAHSALRANGQRLDGTALRSILQSSGGLHFGGNAVSVSFDAATGSSKDAESLSDVVRFFASMIQMQHENQREAALLAPSLNAMRLTTSGSNLHVEMSLPEQAVEELMAETKHPGTRPNP